MTNAIKKRLNKKGFTLAEVLVTVAIILILAGVTFVSVVQYQKNLRLMEMDGTAKEIFIAAQNHLSVAKASGDLDRLAEKANKSANGTTDSPIGTSLTLAPSYASNDSGQYYYVIHNVSNGTESCTPEGSDAILQMMLPFGALDETVSVSGNYAIVYELKSASVVAVLYSGTGNASFGNAAVINFGDDDVSKINEIYNDKSKRKSYEKNGVTAIVGCYTGTAGNAAIPTETLEAPTLEVKNENKLHVLVRGNYSAKDVITLTIHGVQSDTTAIMQLNCTDNGSNIFDVTLDDITVNHSAGKNMRFAEILSNGRFTRSNATSGIAFIPGENIEISATVRATDALATPKTSAVYTTSSLFADVNDGRTVYIKNLRHLENLSVDMSNFAGKLTDKSGTTNGDITAIQKNDITMLSSVGLYGYDASSGRLYIYGSGTISDMYIAANVSYPLSYDGGSHEIYGLSIAPYSGGSGTELNAGIFGNVTNTLSVKNLILRNDKIPEKSSAANAGMLLGKTSANLTVDRVLAYYHEADYNEANDSAVEVQAKQVAGGLIGLVDGGTLNVKNSAAAVYVKGGNAAGGLIGSVSDAANGSIVQSYAGGHTKDGAYSTTDAATKQPVLEGPGRYNVQASGYAGGFIGVTTNSVSMNAVYSTASAYSTDSTKSGSLSGTTNVKFATGNNYYAIGPHNGTDASADDTAKAEIQTGQVRRQATPYDRKLILKGSETEHNTMDKTSYPLCTVRNLCEGDASVKDTDLPWFIKEHVGDWVVTKKTEEPNFEVENGNRLTVRINTGRDEITEDLYYAVKIHEETAINNQDDAYFLLHVNSNNTVTVKRKFNNEGWSEYNHNIAVCKKSTESSFVVELYLDDITNPYGHFGMIFDGNKFIPGEDISINVIPLTNENDVNVTYDETQKIYTNSLFGYLQNGTEYSGDEHNRLKIDAVKSYDSNAGTQKNGEGLIPALNNKYYVQIDNSRHLENLSNSIGYSWPNTIGQKIVGAIQTDNIYWSGETNPGAYTQSIQKELGSDLSVWPMSDPQKQPKTSSGFFSPLDYNTSMTFYDGGNHFIDGLKVNENSNGASLFIMPDSTEMTIKNLTIKNSSFISSKKAAGLISYTGNKLTIENTHCETVIVNGSDNAGGFVGQANGTVNITNCSVNGNITSENGHAGGFVGYTHSEAEIKNATFNGKLTVSGANSSGGIIGNANGKVTVDQATFESDVMVEATSENVHAGGVVGYTNGEADIENVTFFGKLNVYGKNSSGGILGKTGNKLKLLNISIGGPSTITSVNGDAGGVVGFAQSYDADIKNVKFIGKDTEVIAKQNAGGLCGMLTENSSKLTISNVAVSAFIQAEDSAGGLIGRLKTAASQGKIEKSYYGGRTYNGQYASITINNNEKEYTSNIHGSQKAGGLIGYIENTNGLTIDQCFSTGSVENGANNQNAGGFIGMAEQTGVNIKNCYSIGKVSSQNNGGFIGYRNDSSNLTYESVYYLNTFNDPSVKAIGNGSDGENSQLTTKYADNVLGKNETEDVTVQTNSYDEALKGEIYPYKNWTTDWMTKGNPTAYYGDWPLPSKLTGEFIYFSAKDKSNYKDGGLYKVTGQNINVECYMAPIGNFSLERFGFGIISEYPITDQSIYDMLKTRYTWSKSLDEEFKNCKIEGSAAKPEYSVFTYFGKTYYYYRCTSNGGLNIQRGYIYVKDTNANPVITYKVSVSDGEAQFTVVSGA